MTTRAANCRAFGAAKYISPWLALYLLAIPLTYLVAEQPRGQRFWPYLALHLLLTALCAGAWWSARPHAHPNDETHRAVATIVSVGVIARIALILVPSFTSTDLTRYLWDGAVVVHGGDPYRFAPEAAGLAHVRELFPLPQDHLDLPTCYPPLALGLFSIAALAGPTMAFVVWKIMVTAASIGAVLLVHKRLAKTTEANNVAWLSLGPLPVLESAVGGHLDAFVGLAVLLAVLATERQRTLPAGLALGAAAALKLWPVLLALPLLPHVRRPILWLAMMAVPFAVTGAAAMALGMIPLGSLGVVAETWSFGSPVWTALTWLWPDLEIESRLRLAVAITLGGTLAGLAWRHRAQLGRAMTASLASILALNPTLYPWYGVTLACVAPLQKTLWPVAVLSVLPVSYEVIDGYQLSGRWEPRVWPVVVIGVISVAARLAAAGSAKPTPIKAITEKCS